MNNKLFNAKSWLQRAANAPAGPEFRGSELPALPSFEELQNFSPANFLSPGWKGEGLQSKSTNKVQKVLKSLFSDALAQFATFYRRNRTFKYSIYEEFQRYLSQFEISIEGVSSFAEFWENACDKKSPHYNWILPFIEMYSYRAVIFYLYRLKFMLRISETTNIPLSSGDVLNPNSYINRIFRKGSTLQLDCESLQTNLYSWYRPNHAKTAQLEKVLLLLESLQTDEIFKVTDIHDICPNIKKLPLKGTSSHSISQASFGCFINDLIIKLPIWLKKDKFEKSLLTGSSNLPKVVRTKFTGNYLDSFYQSHWFAQAERIENKYNDLICPDFINNDFLNGSFTKYCQEIQFMSFLLELCGKHEQNSLATLCHVMNKKYSLDRKDDYGQIPMFSSCGQVDSEKKYDRIILNLTKLPKKNPHHYLLNQIAQQNQDINDNGIILVFSNQKLFIPSQSDKVEHLLKNLKLEANFNIETLKGKGEIANFLYIFSRRTNPVDFDTQNFTNSLNVFYSNPKESCLTFRWSGELTSFQKFQNLVDEMNNFFEKKSSTSASIFQSELDDHLNFQFHQDAIMEGKLLSSVKEQNEQQITHPSFFKNLTKSCASFESFFLIENYEQAINKNYTSGLLGINNPFEDRFPIVLIVNLTNPQNIQIELIPSNTYRAKFENYGTAFFQYYGLIPKHKEIDLDIFREFFESSIGKQIIQLCLGNSFTKIKSRLKELLIPRFFFQTALNSSDLHESADCNQLQVDLLLQDEDVLRKDPQDLNSIFTNIFSELDHLSVQRPKVALSYLTALKIKLDRNIQKLKDGPQKNLFLNPLVMESLIECQKIPLYPHHPDLFVKLFATSQSDLQSKLTGLDIGIKEEQNCLTLYSYDKKLSEIYGQPEILELTKFILNSAINKPFHLTFFQAELPHNSEVAKILELHQLLITEMENHFQAVSFRISQLISKQISQVLS